MEKPPKFIVIALKTRTTRPFKTQQEVDVFMVGRRPEEWAVYVLVEPPPPQNDVLNKTSK